MKSLLIGAATATSLVALPFAAFAATYQYVNTSGMLETETAANATVALTQPVDIAPHSGVILVPATDVSPITTTTTTTGTVTTVPTSPTNPVTTSTPGSSVANPIWPGHQFNTNTNASTTVVAGTYSGAAPTNFSNGTMFYLNLTNGANSNEGTATLTTTSTGTNPTIETGTWTLVNPAQVQVTLTSNGTANYTTPRTIIFNLNGQTLSASQYDSSVYGTSGFTLTR